MSIVFSDRSAPPVIKFATLALLAAGVALTGWSLFVPLVRFPMVGSTSFVTENLGGLVPAWSIIVVLTVAALLLVFARRLAAMSWLAGGLALGFLAGALYDIYRNKMDQVLQLMAEGGDPSLQKVIDGMQLQIAAWVLLCGVICWLLGAVLSARRGDPYA